MKRVLAMLLATMLLLSLTACGGEKTTSNDGAETIVWIVPGEKQADTEAVMEAASKISMEKIGAKIEIRFIDDAAYTQRMTMNFASGRDEFDLCFTGYINPYKDAVVKGAYLELDDYLKNSAAITESIPEYALENARIDGKIYGVPNMQVLPQCTGLRINKKLADEANFDVSQVKALEDIEPFLAWVKENHPEMYPFRHGQYGGGTREGQSTLAETVTSRVYIIPHEDGSYEVQTEEERSFHAEQDLLRDWFEKGYIRADAATVGDDTSDYLAGKYATWRGWYLPGADIDAKNESPVNECYSVPLTRAYLAADAGTGCMTAINAKTKNPDLAFKMLELMNTDKEFYNLICYGIEGKHYKLTDEGLVELIRDGGYFLNASWKFGSVFNSIPLDGQPKDIWEQTKAFNDSAQKSPIAGFVFDPTNVRTEIAQLATVTGKYNNTFVMPTSEWRDDYYKDLKTAGIDTIKAEVVRQLEEWEKTR